MSVVLGTTVYNYATIISKSMCAKLFAFVI